MIREENLDRSLREQALRARRAEERQQNNRAAASQIVEYLEDSKISVEYFRMKGSVYFSAIEKDDPLHAKLEGNNPKEIKEPKSAKKPQEDHIRFFNISSNNQDEFILSSIMVVQL